jgi:chromate transporter
MLVRIWEVFLAFFKASILSYGGGPASIPLMRSEVVDSYKWFTNDQFADALAIANALPGPIAPKMAAYVGNNVAGIAGAVAGVIASVVPTAIAVVILAKLLLSLKSNPRVISMLSVAKPIVVVLLLQSAIQLMTKGNYPKISSYIVSILAFVLVIFVNVNPAFVMLGGLIVGLTFYKLF